MDHNMRTIFKEHRLRQSHRNNDENRVLRTRICNEQRRQNRNDVFARNRDICVDIEEKEGRLEEDTKSKGTTKLERLKKWKAQKEAAKLRLAQQKKPPFKVGIVRHRIGSPLFCDAAFLHSKQRIKKDPTVQNQNIRPQTRSNTHDLQGKLAQLNVAGPSKLKVQVPVKPKGQLRVASKASTLQSRDKVLPNSSPVGRPTRNLPLRKVDRNDAKPVSSTIVKAADASIKFGGSELIPMMTRGIEGDVERGEFPLELTKKEIDKAPEKINKAPGKINEAPEKINKAPEKINRAAKKINKAPEMINKALEEITRAPEMINKAPEMKINKVPEMEIDEAPEKINTSPEKQERFYVYPAEFSPFVTNVRGKEGGASYTRARAGYTSPRQAELDISVQYYRKTLENEITRLEAECERWLQVQREEARLPGFVTDLVDLAVGQTRLLVTKKFEQFRGLVDKCELGCEGTVVLPTDLQGFWDMVYIQVVNVDLKFEQLVKLQGNNWREEERVVKKEPQKKRAAAKKPVQASSKMKAMIEASRRKKLEAAKTSLETCSSPPRSPRLSSLGLAVNRSSRRDSLLHRALVAEEKRRTASVAELIMSASKLAKIVGTPEDKVVLPMLDLNATPSRGIIKRDSIASRVRSNRRSSVCRVSSRRVQFQEASPSPSPFQ